MEALNRERGSALRIGVGLNLGDACVGNLGSQQRFSYSAIGDTVNLASRVEGLTKYYGVTVMVTDAVRVEAADLAYLELDRVRVVGRTEPVQLFALLGDAQFAQQANFQALAQAHAQVLGLYRCGDFSAALRALGALQAQYELQLLTQLHMLYLQRLEQLIKHPPTQWDGIFTATSK